MVRKLWPWLAAGEPAVTSRNDGGAPTCLAVLSCPWKFDLTTYLYYFVLMNICTKLVQPRVILTPPARDCHLSRYLLQCPVLSHRPFPTPFPLLCFSSNFFLGLLALLTIDIKHHDIHEHTTSILLGCSRHSPPLHPINISSLVIEPIFLG